MACRYCDKPINNDLYFCNDICREKYGLKHYGPATKQIMGVTKAYLRAKIGAMKQRAIGMQRTDGASIQEAMDVFR